jgi:hypothetical protein
MNGNFWMGVIVGVALYWAFQKFGKRATGGQ